MQSPNLKRTLESLPDINPRDTIEALTEYLATVSWTFEANDSTYENALRKGVNPLQAPGSNSSKGIDKSIGSHEFSDMVVAKAGAIDGADGERAMQIGLHILKDAYLRGKPQALNRIASSLLQVKAQLEGRWADVPVNQGNLLRALPAVWAGELVSRFGPRQARQYMMVCQTILTFTFIAKVARHALKQRSAQSRLDAAKTLFEKAAAERSNPSEALQDLHPHLDDRELSELIDGLPKKAAGLLAYSALMGEDHDAGIVRKLVRIADAAEQRGIEQFLEDRRLMIDGRPASARVAKAAIAAIPGDKRAEAQATVAKELTELG